MGVHTVQSLDDMHFPIELRQKLNKYMGVKPDYIAFIQDNPLEISLDEANTIDYLMISYNV